MKLGKLRRVPLCALLLCMATTFTLFAPGNTRYTIPNSQAGFVSTAKALGPEVASKQATSYAVSRIKKGQIQIPVE